MHAGIYRDINDNLVLVQETVDGHFLITHPRRLHHHDLNAPPHSPLSLRIVAQRQGVFIFVIYLIRRHPC